VLARFAPSRKAAARVRTCAWRVSRRSLRPRVLIACLTRLKTATARRDPSKRHRVAIRRVNDAEPRLAPTFRTMPGRKVLRAADEAGGGSCRSSGLRGSSAGRTTAAATNQRSVEIEVAQKASRNLDLQSPVRLANREKARLTNGCNSRDIHDPFTKCEYGAMANGEAAMSENSGRSDLDRRLGRDRRNGIDIRPEEDKRLQGERRFRNRRSGMERRSNTEADDLPKVDPSKR